MTNARQVREWRERHRHPCVDCGKPCSYESIRCRLCSNRYNAKIRNQIYQHGADHPSWKGGKITSSTGYILINDPTHHRRNSRNYVFEHILIWEEANKKTVPKGWIVHHLNGIKTDNRPINLVALPSKKHYLILQAKAKRIQELEALLNNQHQLL